MADIIEVGKRIESARIELNLTQEELAKELGLNKSTIQRYETGKVQKIKIPIIESMARVLRVNPAWISDKSDNRNVWEPSNIDALPNDGIRLIPLYETVSAGFGAFASSEIIGSIPIYIESEYEAQETLCIKVKGDSMYPKIEDGDIIQVHKQSELASGQIGVVLVDGSEGLVKKIYISENKLTLESINPEYHPKVFKNEEMNRVEIVGLVKRIIKEC